MGPVNSPTPPTSQPDSYGPSQMAGDQPPSPPGNTSGVGESPDAQSSALQAVVAQVRTMEEALLSLAQQFPTAAQDARQAVESVRRVLQRIVSTPTAQPEPPAPAALA